MIRDFCYVSTDFLPAWEWSRACFTAASHARSGSGCRTRHPCRRARAEAASHLPCLWARQLATRSLAPSPPLLVARQLTACPTIGSPIPTSLLTGPQVVPDMHGLVQSRAVLQRQAHFAFGTNATVQRRCRRSRTARCRAARTGNISGTCGRPAALQRTYVGLCGASPRISSPTHASGVASCWWPRAIGHAPLRPAFQRWNTCLGVGARMPAHAVPARMDRVDGAPDRAQRQNPRQGVGRHSVQRQVTVAREGHAADGGGTPQSPHATRQKPEMGGTSVAMLPWCCSCVGMAPAM